jgi:hypothetical protein
MVMLFSDDKAPVRVSLAVKVTSACGVGAVPLLNTLAFASGSFSVNDVDCPAATLPIAFPLASAWMLLAVRLTMMTGKSDS